MKTKRNTILLLAFYALLLLLVGFSFPKQINWTPTFSQEHKLPYGSLVLRERLKDLFNEKSIGINTKPFYNFGGVDYVNQNFIVITDNFKADALDINALLNFVDEGNNVFIAAQDLPEKLCDTLGISVLPQYKYFTDKIFENGDSIVYLGLNFTDEKLRTSIDYQFKGDPIIFELTNIKFKGDSLNDSTNKKAIAPNFEIEKLGKSKTGETVFGKIKYGNGNLFIHTFPLAFTNYNMLRSPNEEYAAKCFSYLPATNLFWDEYYKPLRQGQASTPLRYILSVPAYARAYYIAIFGLIVYMVFAGKRLQKVIPVITPYQNQSLEFTRTIGTLYFNKQNHKDLAEKKMLYFLEKERHYFYLTTTRADNSFMQKLSQKSGVDFDSVKNIFTLHEVIKRSVEISDEQLHTFNSAIEKFYNTAGLNNK